MIKKVIEGHREFFRSGKTLDISFRIAALKRLRTAIMEMEAEIEAALKADLGKSATESYMCEVGLSLSEISDTLRHIKRWSRKKRVKTPIVQFPAKSYIIPEPYGNVLIMSPWNYPFLLCISPLISAVAAGNTAVVKPSAYSPRTSEVVAKLIAESFDENHVTTVTGGREANTELLKQKFDYIFFTGSKDVGRIVMEKAAAHLTPLTLELGGKSPVVIDRTTDLRVSARRLVFGKYLNCGQTCVAPDHVFVHEDVAELFMELCKEEILSMYGFNALANPDYGRIVNKKHFDRLVATLHEGIKGNPGEKREEAWEDKESEVQTAGELIFGGRYREESLQIEPTVIYLGRLNGNATEQDFDSLTIMKDEIFGPLLPLITYNDIDAVINYIDRHPRPLASYIFTQDKKLKHKLLKELHFGGGCVNDTIIHLATDEMPFGGVGESGMGHYHGKYGFDTFSHLKSIVDKPTWLDLTMRYQPYTAVKEKLIKMFLK